MYIRFTASRLPYYIIVTNILSSLYIGFKDMSAGTSNRPKSLDSPCLLHTGTGPLPQSAGAGSYSMPELHTFNLVTPDLIRDPESLFCLLLP